MASGYPTSNPHGKEIQWGTWTENVKPVTRVKTSAEVVNDLVKSLVVRGVGFNAQSMFFKELENQFATKATYPPYDILGGEDGEYEIRMALAGFKKSDLSITFQDQVLTVKSVPKEGDDPGRYFHKGIAAREFTLSFPLAEYVLVEGATMEDGILTVSLKRELPEELKPKTIKIK